jgi:hypothetical protein
VRDLTQCLRILGIAVGVVFVIAFVWIVLLGPAALVLLAPRS